MFQLLRFYAVSSLFAIVAAAGLLTWLHRTMAIDGMVALARREMTEVAQIALVSIQPSVVALLADRRARGGTHEVPLQLQAGIHGLLSDHGVLGVTLYDERGRMAYSTDHEQPGRGPGDDAALRPVLAGEARSELLLRRARNAGEEAEGEPGNVMRTRLAVRGAPTGPVLGVFEMRADANFLVRQTEQAALRVFWGVLFILGLLYGALLAIVRYASRRIQLQQREMGGRSAALAVLAGQMLKGEDARRREMALGLHEGLAQTLTAAKLHAEVGQANPDAARVSSGAVIPLLRDAIEEVRAIAADLRPASLDELGLLPTLHSMVRELERQHPDVRVTSGISVQEDEVRTSLKGIIYRIASVVLGAMTQAAGGGSLRLCLRIEEGELLVLRIRCPGKQSSGFMEQLTTLSGGTFSSAPDGEGGTILRAAWSSHPTTPGELVELPS